MPSYANTQPPYSLAPGDAGCSFNNEAVPSVQAGAQFALPHPAGIPDQSRAVRSKMVCHQRRRRSPGGLCSPPLDPCTPQLKRSYYLCWHCP